MPEEKVIIKTLWDSYLASKTKISYEAALQELNKMQGGKYYKELNTPLKILNALKKIAKQHA